MPLEAGDIQALAAALQGLRPAAPVNATAVKLPQFWQGNPEVWFKQTESVFTTRNPAITTQQTKFDYVIQALDNNTAEKVQSLILNPPAQPYDRLKAALIALKPQRIRNSLTSTDWVTESRQNCSNT